MAYQVKPYLNLPDDYDPVLAELYNNGCGPAGWKKFIPQHSYCMRISDACHVHDFDFGKEKERGYFRLPRNLHPIVIEYIKENHENGTRGAFKYIEMYNYRFWSNLLMIIETESVKKPWTDKQKKKYSKMGFFKKRLYATKIRMSQSKIFNPLRRRRAKTYFWFVSKMGGEYFNK